MKKFTDNNLYNDISNANYSDRVQLLIDMIDELWGKPSIDPTLLSQLLQSKQAVSIIFTHINQVYAWLQYSWTWHNKQEAAEKLSRAVNIYNYLGSMEGQLPEKLVEPYNELKTKLYEYQGLVSSLNRLP